MENQNIFFNSLKHAFSHSCLTDRSLPALILGFIVVLSTPVSAQEATSSLDTLLSAAEAENVKLQKLKELRQQNIKLRAELGIAGHSSETRVDPSASTSNTPVIPEPKEVVVEKTSFGITSNRAEADNLGSAVKALSPTLAIPDNANRRTSENLSVPKPAQVQKTDQEKLNERLQVYFGTEIVGASSADSEAQPYFNVRLNVPIRYRDRCDSDSTTNLGCLKFWADFRLASSPTQTLPDFASLEGTAAGGFFGSNQSSSINQLVKTFQTKIGVEYGLGRSFALIGGAGITSPLSSTQSVQVYKIPRLENGEVLPSFIDVFGDIDYTGLENLVLTSGERDRFFRNWFVGGRLRGKFWDDAYPAEFDLTFGQDEVITKKLAGGVLKFDATIPIKVADRDFLYFGAGFGLRLTRRVNVVTLPFFLEPIADFSLFANNNLVRNFDDTPFGTSNRDNYSFRVGVDLLRLFNK